MRFGDFKRKLSPENYCLVMENDILSSGDALELERFSKLPGKLEVVINKTDEAYFNLAKTEIENTYPNISVVEASNFTKIDRLYESSSDHTFSPEYAAKIDDILSREKIILENTIKDSDIVYDGKSLYEVLDIGTNYLHVIDQLGNITKKWFNDVKIKNESHDEFYKGVKQNSRFNQIVFKGYRTKNFTEETKLLFNDLKKQVNDSFALLSAIQCTDRVLGNINSISEIKVDFERSGKILSKFGVLERHTYRNSIEDQFIEMCLTEGLDYRSYDITKIDGLIEQVKNSSSEHSSVLVYKLNKIKGQ